MNPTVTAIYKFIKDHERFDSDYWNEDHGSEDLIRFFEHLTEDDWKDLAFDLKNWTDSQLEIFTQAILGGYLSYTNKGIYYSDRETIRKLTKTIPHRFDLLFPIIKIETERKIKYQDFSFQIIENLNFITDHFEILMEKDSNYLVKIQELFNQLGLSEANSQTAIALKEKIEKAIR